MCVATALPSCVAYPHTFAIAFYPFAIDPRRSSCGNLERLSHPL